MKKLICALVVALLMPVMVLAQEKYLDKFPNGTNIESVYLSKNMINVTLNELQSDPQFELCKNLFSDLNGMEVYTCNDTAKLEEISKMLSQLVEAKKATLYAEEKTEESQAQIYTVTNSGESQDDALILCQITPQDAFIMVMHGDIDPTRVVTLCN